MTLDQIVTLSDEREVSQPDGSLTLSLVNSVQLFAAIKPISGSERYVSGQVRAPALYRFHLRQRAINESQVITWKGEKFNIRYLGTSGERGVYIWVDAEKDVAQ